MPASLLKMHSYHNVAESRHRIAWSSHGLPSCILSHNGQTIAAYIFRITRNWININTAPSPALADSAQDYRKGKEVTMPQKSEEALIEAIGALSGRAKHNDTDDDNRNGIFASCWSRVRLQQGLSR